MHKPPRDLTKAQFDREIEKWGFKATGFMGYYRLPAPCSHIEISKHNAGKRRRDQLAYLLREFDRHQKEASHAH